jgi:uncharacterized BrkB/YihY/UPF0761 family membrane protein
MAQVWNVPLVDRPGFVQRLGRSLTFLLLLGLFVALSTALDGIATSGGSTPMAIRAAVTVASVVANVVLFAMAFRILTPSQVRTHDLLLGALAGGLAWTVLQSLGTFLVNHELRHAGQLYGFFGIVIGLLWWLYLAVQLTLYAAEINVVCSRRLWPRSIVQPPLTDADREMLSAYLHEARRRPEQEVSAGLRVRKDTAESNGGNR